MTLLSITPLIIVFALAIVAVETMVSSGESLYTEVTFTKEELDLLIEFTSDKIGMADIEMSKLIDKLMFFRGEWRE